MGRNIYKYNIYMLISIIENVYRLIIIDCNGVNVYRLIPIDTINSICFATPNIGVE